MRSLVKLACLPLCLLSFSSFASDCLEVSAHDALPNVIERGKCYELQGDNVIDGQTIVSGRLFIKAGRSVRLVKDSSIILTEDSLFENRGNLSLEPESTLSLTSDSTFNNTGNVTIKDATIGSNGNAQLNNLGKLHLIGSNIYLTEDCGFKNSSIIDLNSSGIESSNNCDVLNQGTLIVRSGSYLSFLNKAQFSNLGSLQVERNALLKLLDNSHMVSRRRVVFDGTFALNCNAIYENFAVFELAKGSNLNLTDNAQIVNGHTFTIGSDAVLSARARLLNTGTLVIAQKAKTHVAQNSVVINNGTFRNEGGDFEVDSSDNFINQKIISGNNSRDRK